MHFTCQKMHSPVRASFASILLAVMGSLLVNASWQIEFYTPASSVSLRLHTCSSFVIEKVN